MHYWEAYFLYFGGIVFSSAQELLVVLSIKITSGGSGEPYMVVEWNQALPIALQASLCCTISLILGKT